jgi:hypothetical protein
MEGNGAVDSQVRVIGVQATDRAGGTGGKRQLGARARAGGASALPIGDARCTAQQAPLTRMTAA